MKTLSQYKNEQMKNPDFAAAYNEFQPEIEIIRAIVDARANANISQKELSERTGIAQAEISRIENGRNYPSFETLEKILESLDISYEDIFQFNHLVSKETLIEKINTKLNNLDEKNLRFVYKIINEI